MMRSLHLGRDHGVRLAERLTRRSQILVIVLGEGAGDGRGLDRRLAAAGALREEGILSDPGTDVAGSGAGRASALAVARHDTTG
jgi:hypothetical protein